MISSSILSLLFAASAVSAIPFHQVVDSLPRDVTHIALDEINARYLAYKRDGTLYGTFSSDVGPGQDFELHARNDTGPSCSKLSTDEVQTLPGWSTITKYASDNWGTGSYNLETNPTAYPSQPANACVSSDVVSISLSGSPSCNTNSAETGGTLAGTSGTVGLSVEEGYTSSSTWTVTTTSSIGVSATVSASFGIPDIAGGGASITTSSEFTNEQSNSFQTSVDNQVTQQLTIESPSGKTCKATYNVKTCNTQGEGKIRFLATGWVWFNYNDQTQGHYKWAASIDSILTNQDDRSSWLDFTGTLTGTSNSNYTGSCS